MLDFVKPQTVDTSSNDEAIWNTTGYYEIAGNRNISTYMGGNWGGLVYHWQWFNFGLPFFQDYRAANDGRIPFVAPSPAGRWSFGRTNVSEELFQDFMQRKATYESFIKDHVLTYNNETCTNAIIVTPSNIGSGPNYRVSVVHFAMKRPDIIEPLPTSSKCRYWLHRRRGCRCFREWNTRIDHPYRSSSIRVQHHQPHRVSSSHYRLAGCTRL